MRVLKLIQAILDAIAPPFLFGCGALFVAEMIDRSHGMATPTAILFLSAVIAIKDFK